MIIDLNSIDRNNFQVKEGIFCNEKAFLVTPNHIGTKFTQRNKIFRSSIWSEDGELLSGGLKKFVNAGENPENFPLPTSLNNTSAVLKIDGSSLILNKRNGILNCRTRGTFEASGMENYYELQVLQEKYPFAFDNPLLNNEDCSFVFEWVSPENVIVIKYPEPDIYLLNIIKHSNYSYYTQSEINEIAREYELKRPEIHFFNTVDQMASEVKYWKDNEGIVLYHSNSQECHKYKADRYLYIHSIKSSLNTLEKLIDLFLLSGATNFNEFFKYIEENIDYEVARHFIGEISNICEANKEVNKILDHMRSFVLSLQGMSRKEQAIKITSSYGTTNRSSFAFTLLDNKELENKQIKKLFFQVLK